jgi:hypothetical protein
MNKQGKQRLIIFLFSIFAVWLLSSGATDLDWIVNLEKWQMGQGAASVLTWTFSPYFSLNWWLAYMISLIRVVAGCGIFGLTMGWLLFHKEEKL